MSWTCDHTHDPDLTSWVDGADAEGTDFPIQNLPLCTFRPPDARTTRVGVGIGSQVLDLSRCARTGLLEGLATLEACAARTLNAWMACSADQRRSLRNRLSELLSLNASVSQREKLAGCLVPMEEACFLVPAAIGDYTDFYASIHHASNIGSMFRPDNPLLPNYRYMPIGYHGRSSSIVVSGSAVRRPAGQSRPEDNAPPVFGPCAMLDYELEVGAFVGPGNPPGRPISLARAEDHLAGLCLVNDWSARDLQRWEYQPLGPFLSKSFATSVSPWVVTREALLPFRAPAFARGEDDPPLLPHLASEENQAQGGFHVTLEVHLTSERMRREGLDPVRLSRGNLADLYWTPAQMIAHHTSNGCNLRPGDLLASGTVSGPEPASRGCLMELTWRGSEPLELPTGEARSFLEDGDEVILSGCCEREGFARIGFGECRGRVEAAG